jgi:excisionase family DNA binding protein/PAS domain S-box-containing protein
MEKTLFSTTEMAGWLGVFHTTARRWIEQGKIKGIRVGRNYKIPIDEALRVLKHYEIPLPECLRKYEAEKGPGSARLSANQALNSSILKKLLVVEEIEDPALACTENAVLGANQALCRLLGYSQLGLIGVDVQLIMDDTTVDKLVEFTEARSANGFGSATAYEANLIADGGSQKRAQITVSALDQLKGVFLLVVKPVNGQAI